MVDPAAVPTAASIATLDFSKYLKGTEAERKEFCIELVKAFQRWGFVRLVNYGIDPADIEDLFAWSRRFFALSHDQKMEAKHPPNPNPHRGYSFVGQEFTSDLSRPREQAERQGRRIFDVKESFDQGPADDKIYENVWPDEGTIPGFRAVMERHFARAHAVHLSVLQALADGFSLPSNLFPDSHHLNESEMRLLHYPEIPSSELGNDKGTGRIAEHTDSGSATLLWQDDVGGLEIEDPVTHQFVPVVAPYPAVLVNLGDAMERWSNGVLHAGYHRVRKPPSQDSTGQVPARFSIVYFGKPDRDAKLAPLDRFVTADRPAKFPPITGGELNQATLLKTYKPAETEV